MERPIIATSEGRLQGATLKSVLGKEYLAFRGIPYAKPPLGDLRFREPQPPENSSYNYQCVSHGDELSCLFYYNRNKDPAENAKYLQGGCKDRVAMERLTRLWYNFAATGDPTPVTDNHLIPVVWKPSTKKNLYYLDIGDELTLREDEGSERRKLYEKIKDHFFFGI